MGELAKLMFVTTTDVSPDTTDDTALEITVVKTESNVASDVVVMPKRYNLTFESVAPAEEVVTDTVEDEIEALVT